MPELAVRVMVNCLAELVEVFEELVELVAPPQPVISSSPSPKSAAIIANLRRVETGASTAPTTGRAVNGRKGKWLRPRLEAEVERATVTLVEAVPLEASTVELPKEQV